MLELYISILETPEEVSKFEQLFNAYKYTMLYTAQKILNDKGTAEDAVQEAFIRTAKNLHKIAEVNCPQTKYFIVTIVKNVSLSMLKKNSKSETFFDEHDEEQKYREIISSDIFENFDAALITNEILKLPDIYKDVLSLECVGEYRINEISKLLGITKEAAKKRSQRGKKILIENLRKEGLINGK